MRTRDFAQALPLAEKLGYTFDRHAIQALEGEVIAPGAFIEFARSANELDRAYNWLAAEYETRGDYANAYEYSGRVSEASDEYAGATRIRVRCLGHLLRSKQIVDDDDAHKVTKLLQYVATHPSDVESRFEVEALLEDGIEEPSARVLLTVILGRTVNERYPLIAVPAGPPQIVPLSAVVDNTPENVPKLFEGIASDSSNKGAPFGLGSIPEGVAHLASPSALRTLFHVLQARFGQPGAVEHEMVLRILHTIFLVSRYLKDKGGDLLGLRLAVGGLANSGFQQQARDLAETALTLVANEPEVNTWRIANAWAAYADAFHRSGNLGAGLRCLCLCFLAWEGPSLDLTLSASNLRLAARILRDYGFTDQALEMLVLEKGIYIETGLDEKTQLELEQMELSILTIKAGNSASPEYLLELLGRGEKLLEKARGRETAPILILVAQLTEKLKSNGVKIPDETSLIFYGEVEKQNDAVRALIETALTSRPTREQVLSSLERVATASFLSDMAYQLQPLQIMAERALHTAAQDNDIDLFVVASVILSQPILTSRSRNRPASSGFRNTALASRWLSTAVRGGASLDAIRDAVDVARTIAEPAEETLSHVQSLTVDQLASIIAPDEALVIVALGPTNQLYRATLGATAAPSISAVSEDEWSPNEFQAWSHRFPKRYGKWLALPIWEEEEITAEEVVESVRKLKIRETGTMRLLTIAPDAQLFGFPYNLVVQDDDLHTHTRQLAIVPSAQWLVEVRSHPWTGTEQKAAWLGSPATMDMQLHFLRDRLAPVLQQHSIEMLDVDSPQGMENSSLVIAASHGGTGLLDYFRKVTDNVTAFSIEDFAAHFRNCACVVLFVCSAGRADKQFGSAETTGLVAALLRKGVRAVVASPWPLNNYIPSLWLPPFLSSLQQGQSVGMAVHEACRVVSITYPHPSAWAAMHLYGDGALKITAAEANVREAS